MWQIIENAVGSVLGAIIIGLFGIGGTTVVINSASGSYNPRKKWRILMIVSVVIGVVVGVLTTSYSGGYANTSDFGGTIVWMCIIAFGIGWVGNFVNK